MTLPGTIILGWVKLRVVVNGEIIPPQREQQINLGVVVSGGIFSPLRDPYNLGVVVSGEIFPPQRDQKYLGVVVSAEIFPLQRYVCLFLVTAILSVMGRYQLLLIIVITY